MKKTSLFQIILLLCCSTANAQLFNPVSSINLPEYAGSASWGDYDKDGYVDLLVVGRDNNSKPISKVFQNKNGTLTEQTNIILVGLVGKGVWGDYDKDGWLDILISGQDVTYRPKTVIYRNNGDGSFSLQSQIVLPGTQAGDLAWCDFNNDSYLDIILSGNAGIPDAQYNQSGIIYTLSDNDNFPKTTILTKIFYNDKNNNFIENKNCKLIGITLGSVDCGDYNNDGFMDILLTGIDSTFSNRISKIYRNNRDGTFIEQTDISLIGISYGCSRWGDYDNDSLLDILSIGENESNIKISQIYKNNGDNNFSLNNDISIIGISHGNAAWGDYDNDGYTDFVLTGNTSSRPTSIIYHNTKNGNFTKVSELLSVYESNAIWGDYDNDQDLDLIICGATKYGFISKIYQNNTQVNK